MGDIKNKLCHYYRAEVTIVALNEKATKKFFNIYSVVEFCTKDQMKSEPIGNKKHPYIREKLDDNYTLFIRRVFFDEPSDGYNFFKNSGVRPIFDGQQKDDVLYDYGEVVSEPDGSEGLIFHSGSLPKGKLEDILPEFSGTYRVYVQLAVGNEFGNLLINKSMLKAGFIVQKALGIPLLSHMEYWGSVFLCLPDPYIKRVELKLGKDGRKLLVRLLMRKDAPALKGFLELTDERRLGKGFCLRHEITKNVFSVEMPNEPEQLRYRIFTQDGELIEESANYFMKKIHYQMEILAGRRRFIIPGREKTDVEMKSYEEFFIGDKEIETYAEYLNEEERKRSLEALEAERVFMYFPGNRYINDSRDKAVSILKELIGKAQRTCILCDPYFSNKDFLEYGIVVSSINVVLHVVTSEAFLLQPFSEDNPVKQGELLIDLLEQWHEHAFFCFHVLKGRKRSPLHDRFMVLDDDVYLLGSSFSEFGSRATTLYKIPNPDLMKHVAERWIKNEDLSLSFEEWVEEFKKLKE